MCTNYNAQEKTVELIGTNKTVLDVGCGWGYVSSKLKENKCMVYGIEIEPDLAEKAKMYCVDVLNANLETIEKLPYSNEQFDAVLLGDILEHLREPNKLLNKIDPILKKDGIVIASIPNVVYWRNRLNLLFGRFKYTEGGTLAWSHLRFFNYFSAKELFKNAGYKVVKEDFVPPIIFPITKILYFLAHLFPNLLAAQFILVANKINLD
jgi:methionine biosynthesis protein MetW